MVTDLLDPGTEWTLDDLMERARLQGLTGSREDREKMILKSICGGLQWGGLKIKVAPDAAFMIELAEPDD